MKSVQMVTAMVVDDDIKAGVIWAGLVVPYPEMMAAWDDAKRPATSTTAEDELPFPSVLVGEYGTPG